MNWFILACLSAVLYAGKDLYAKSVLKGKKTDAMAFTILQDCFAAIVALPFLFLLGVSYPTNYLSLLALLIVTVLYAISDLLIVKSLSLEDASIVIPIFKLRTVITFILSIVFLDEEFTNLKAISILLILAGAIIITFKKKEVKLSKGILYILITSVTSSIAFTLDKAFIENYSVPVYVFFVFILPAFWIFLITKNRVERVMKEFSFQKERIIILGSLFGLEMFAYFSALKLGEVSRVLPVFELSLGLTVLGSIVLLAERKDIFKKLIGSLLILVGVILIRL